MTRYSRVYTYLQIYCTTIIIPIKDAGPKSKDASILNKFDAVNPKYSPSYRHLWPVRDEDKMPLGHRERHNDSKIKSDRESQKAHEVKYQVAPCRRPTLSDAKSSKAAGDRSKSYSAHPVHRSTTLTSVLLLSYSIWMYLPQRELSLEFPLVVY